MSVLIKGMEMPTSCERCPMLDWDLDYVKCKVTDRHFNVVTECWRAIRVPDCPLVPVPPHGRLIDADALIDWLYDDEPSAWKAPFRLCTADRSDVKFLLKNAPTIILASGGDAE